MSTKKKTEVVITSIEIPFWRLVGIMMKWMIAAIPAAALFALLVLLVQFLFTVFVGGIFILGGNSGGS